MTLVARYLTKRLIASILSTLIILCGLLLVWMMLSKYKHMTSWSSVGFTTLANFYELPSHLYKVYPVVLFFSVLRVFAHMEIKGEWLAMRALGLSKEWIIRTTACVLIVFSLFIVVVGEGLAPFARKKANYYACHKASLKVCPDYRDGWVLNQDQVIRYYLNMKTKVLGPLIVYNLTREHDSVESIVYSKRAIYKHHQWQIKGKEYFPGRQRDISQYRIRMPFTIHDIDFMSLKLRYLPIWLMIKMYVQNDLYHSTIDLGFIKVLIDSFVWVIGSIVLTLIFSGGYLTCLRSKMNPYTMVKKIVISVVAFFMLFVLYNVIFLL